MDIARDVQRSRVRILHHRSEITCPVLHVYPLGMGRQSYFPCHSSGHHMFRTHTCQVLLAVFVLTHMRTSCVSEHLSHFQNTSKGEADELGDDIAAAAQR